MKKVICIGGSDSSLGAGIELDQRILSNLEANFETVTTAYTFQTHQEFINADFVDPEILKGRLLESFPESPCIVKIGMIGSFDNLKVLYDFFSKRKDFIILDPILYSTTGAPLLEKIGLNFFKEHFFSLVDLLTPNLNELRILLGEDGDPKDFFQFGVKNVLLKGGHFNGEDNLIHDYFFSCDEDIIISTKRIKRNFSTRGTGCALAASLAFGLSIDLPLKEALIFAKIYFTKNFRNATFENSAFVIKPKDSFGDGLTSEDMPFLNFGEIKFPELGMENLELYPIVERADFLNKLLGVKIAQLRIKDLRGKELEFEIKKGIEISKELGINLFINDYFELAKKHSAFGVHLGQEDLFKYDRNELLKSGLRLGISTHSYFELATALGYQPSYVAFGPIYFTTLKKMQFSPQGIEKLKIIRKLVKLPLVAIGGITLEKLEEILEGGADFISVISDISKNPDPSERVRKWIGALQ
jgi:hydroxymethylpyrimidine kinase / phosphomethylpyrimidine kinase / thiamine-phosphate diphosphorylase